MKSSTMYQQVILASSSQARIEYLENAKVDFKVHPHKINESNFKKKKRGI